MELVFIAGTETPKMRLWGLTQWQSEGVNGLKRMHNKVPLLYRVIWVFSYSWIL